MTEIILPACPHGIEMKAFLPQNNTVILDLIQGGDKATGVPEMMRQFVCTQTQSITMTWGFGLAKMSVEASGEWQRVSMLSVTGHVFEIVCREFNEVPHPWTTARKST